uniref:Uncharacterized protein n=1 Tax=Rhizophora mucronata TaxID=61149 RepID=A0A2P2JQK8_RHIMU
MIPASSNPHFLEFSPKPRRSADVGRPELLAQPRNSLRRSLVEGGRMENWENEIRFSV